MDKFKYKLVEQPEYVLVIFSIALMAFVMFLLVIGHDWSEKRWFNTLGGAMIVWTIAYLAWLKKL